MEGQSEGEYWSKEQEKNLFCVLPLREAKFESTSCHHRLRLVSRAAPIKYIWGVPQLAHVHDNAVHYHYQSSKGGR